LISGLIAFGGWITGNIQFHATKPYIVIPHGTPLCNWLEPKLKGR